MICLLQICRLFVSATGYYFSSNFVSPILSKPFLVLKGFKGLKSLCGKSRKITHILSTAYASAYIYIVSDAYILVIV